MEIVIHGDKVKITESMNEYIVKKINKLEKYLKDNDTVRANVIVRVKNNIQTVEITVPIKTLILRSEESKEDFYAAVDKAVEKLERQIRKNKTRLQSKKVKTIYEFDFTDIVEEDEDTNNNKITKRKRIEIFKSTEEFAWNNKEKNGEKWRNNW